MTRITATALAAFFVLGACASTQETVPTTSADATVSEPAFVPRQAADSYYVSAHTAVSARKAERNPSRAKNVILFVGDGMGVSSITAGRIFAGQSKGVDGESYELAMEQLPYSAMVKTYTHDSQVADSAPTAAAMTTGVKSANGTIGVTQAATPRNCATQAANGTDSLWEIAEDAGLSTGVISTARLTHATPAATYAKTVDRDWESDANLSAAARAEGCADIARQFVEWKHGDGFEVALGGGRANFLPASKADPEYPDRTGARSDDRDLVEAWNAQGANHVFVTDKAGFDATDFDSDTSVLGLFEPSHMQYEADRNTGPDGEPSVAEMTRAAITRLSRDEDGFVLMVEGGRIDHAHHAGNAARALTDLAALDEAVAVAREMTNPEDTLIVVTADHSHTLVIQGYPGRNNPILGFVLYPGIGEPAKAADGKPYTTLAYANGPGAICIAGDDGDACERADLQGADPEDVDFIQQATVPFASETHAGEDVALYASGPGANLFSGTIEQHEIFHVMAQSLGLVE